jgi:hypothetical protein
MSIYDAQQFHTNQTHFLRKAIAYTDNGSTLSMGWVPPGAAVIGAGVNVYTAFNGNSSNVLDIGYRNGGNSETDDTDEYATDIALGTAGVIVADELATAAVNYFANGAEIVAVVVSTASASAGAGIVWLEYTVANT